MLNYIQYVLYPAVFNNKITVEIWTPDARYKLDSEGPFIIMFLDDKQPHR